jgi:hypothetical protein
VPPCVRYGTTYLLIRVAVGSVPCLDEWEFDVVTRPCSHGARGATATTPGNLSNAMVLRTTLARLGIQPMVNLCNGM